MNPLAIAAGWMARNRLVAGLAGVLLLIAVVTGAYWKGRADESGQVRQRAAAAQSLQDVKAAVAGGHVNLSLQTDAATTAAHQKDLEHADDAVPDAGPSRARLALSCQRLCDQGADLAKAPACGGLVCRAQAPAHR